MSERERDERDLRMLQLRAFGFASCDIGARLGLSGSYVRVRSNRIQKADEDHTGLDLSARY